MRRIIATIFVGLALAFPAIIGATARAADCAQLVNDFNRAVDAGAEAEAQKLTDQIALDPQCGRFQIPVQRRLAAFRLAAVQYLMARGRPTGDYERLLTEAERPEVLWQASATQGEVRFGERRFVDAAMAFDRAIESAVREVGRIVVCVDAAADESTAMITILPSRSEPNTELARIPSTSPVSSFARRSGPP